MTETELLFSNKEYCFEEILRIREMMSNKSTFTEKNIDAARWTLGLMSLYCPDEIKSTVEGQLNELIMREALCLIGGKRDG